MSATERYTSSDGLMRSADPSAVALWESIGQRMAEEESSWTEILRAMGVKLAHPDDGWVHRERNNFTLSWYPQFDDHPEVGDLIAFGCTPRPFYGLTGYCSNMDIPKSSDFYEKDRTAAEVAKSGYRIVRVTKAERRHGILGYHQDFDYEDSGVRVPPRAPRRSFVKRLLRRG